MCFGCMASIKPVYYVAGKNGILPSEHSPNNLRKKKVGFLTIALETAPF